jgi:5'-nucleotidase
MRILICNDDGIEAPGLNALEEIARDLSDDVGIVAPETDSRCIAFPDAR